MEHKKRFSELLEVIKPQKNINTSLIKKAYDYANILHAGQKRKTGEPYITHPREVAIIIAKLGFDETVIAAAILHDVIEDCDCTVEDLKKHFNAKIANLVDAVTAIKAYEGKSKEFKKLLMKEKAYNKLYTFAMNEKLAFYIKFADRLHNLSTISIFPKYKQIEKVKETQKWLTPVLSSIKAVYLYYELENRCQSILEEKEYSIYNKYYKYYLENNRKYFSYLESEFVKSLSKNSKQVGKFLDLKFDRINLFELMQNQSHLFDLREEKIDQFIFYKMVTHKIFIIVRDISKKENKMKILLRLFGQIQWFKNFKVLGFFGDKKFKNHIGLLIQDAKGFKFSVYLMTYAERFKYLNGEVTGIEVPYDEGTGQFEISENYIKVYTSKNEEIILPEKSTVLDFAFKIHNDFGFSCTGAFINESPNKVPIYTVLNNGDKINLEIERDESEECIDMSQIKWLSYVNTDAAKKKLIKKFESKYENVSKD